jgi:anti-sigma regulatory factor (Ser/Thr protein kinase)
LLVFLYDPVQPMPSLPSRLSDAPLKLLPELGQLDSLIGYIEEFAARHGWVAADTHAFSLAAEELFANTLRHSQPPATFVEFSLAIVEGVATGQYSDDGSPFDPTARPEVDTTLPVEQRQIGGLGIHFIRRTMQTFTYRRDGERNIVSFGRALTGP